MEKNDEIEGKLINNEDTNNNKEIIINEEKKTTEIITTNNNISTENNVINNADIIMDLNGKNRTIDHLITIQYSKIFRFPYFIFGGMLHFYCPRKKFASNPIKLSEMPTPPFAVVRTECKYHN